MKTKKQKIFTALLFAIYLLLLAGIILFKLPFYSAKLSDGVRVVNLIPFYGSFDENGNLLLSEIVQNILIFIPLGIYISMCRPEFPFLKKGLLVLSCTVFFEVVQFIFAIGRCDITDVIDNALGGILGIGIYRAFRHFFKEKAENLMLAAAAVVTAFVLVRFSQLFYLSHFVMRRLR